MTKEEILSIGFKRNEWTYETENFLEYVKGNGSLGILISSTNFVEITVGNGVFITVPNCKTIDDLKSLVRLLGL
jgi:hypothetical protein